MVHTAIRELTGIENTAAAWKSLFPGITPDKKVSIKINLSCGDVPTHPEIVNAIIDGLLMMDLDGEQLPEEHIIVWDHDNPFFCQQTGYTQNWGGSGVQYVGTSHPEVGFDYGYSFVIEHPVSDPSVHHPSRLITDYTDYLINAAVMKDHNDAGATFTLKNHYGSFSNVNIWPLHLSGPDGDGHTRGEPELNRVLRDELDNKPVLWLVDATLCLYVGGPGYVPPWHTYPNWAYNSFLAGFDPVAIDRISTIKLNEERVRQGEEPVDPSHIRVSAEPPYNLGAGNPDEIELVEIDVSQPTGVEPGFRDRNGVALLAPCPNPARGQCTIRFHCAVETEVEIAIVDVRGALVRQVTGRSRYPRGTHRLAWDGSTASGRAAAPGIYFVRLSAGERTETKRIVRVE